MNVIYKDGNGEITEKKSRFIANVFHIDSEENAQELIQAAKKKYWDARHNCYAYVLGEKGEIQRFSDDGEPQGTAGKPILEVINGNELSNTLIIVTRYFGGVLLGTGGLIRAYTEASKAGIEGSGVAQAVKGISANLTLDYTMLGKIQHICNELGVEITDTVYAENVIITMHIRDESRNKLEKSLTEASAGRLMLENEEAITMLYDPAKM